MERDGGLKGRERRQNGRGRKKNGEKGRDEIEVKKGCSVDINNKIWMKNRAQDETYRHTIDENETRSFKNF